MNKIATGMGRKPKNEAQNYSESALYNIVSMLVLTGDVQKVSETFSQKYHLSEKETANLIRLAREKINLASEIEKKEELGKRIIQLDELYERSLKTDDTKTALLTLKEKSKLLDLYAYFSKESFLDASENIELDLVRKHLEGLDITSKQLAIEELARQVSIFVIDRIQSEQVHKLRSA